MARLRGTASAARSVLDGREQDGTIECVGAAIHASTNQQIAETKHHQKT